MSNSPTPEPSPHGYTLHFTPVEWRMLLRDGDFLNDPENSIRPRRWMGIPVEIVNDRRCYFDIVLRTTEPRQPGAWGA